MFLLYHLYSVLTQTIEIVQSEMLSIRPGRVWQEFTNRKANSSERVVMYCELNIYRHGTPLRIKHLALKWKPTDADTDPPQQFTPVLYHARRAFNPTSQAALSDGKWNRRTQTIHFDLNYKLIGRHTLYIVMLAESKALEKLAHGHFVYSDAYPLVTTPVTAESF